MAGVKIYYANALGFYRDTDIVSSVHQNLTLEFKRASMELEGYNPFPNNILDKKVIAETNRRKLDETDVVIAFLDYSGASIDDGIAWELGYFYGLKQHAADGKKRLCIGLTDSIRTTDVGGSIYNLQVMEHLDGVFSIKTGGCDLSDFLIKKLTEK